MLKAKFMTDVLIKDSETQKEVYVSIYKHPNGGMFGMDSSFLEQKFEDDVCPIIADPYIDIFDENAKPKLIMLVN